MSFTKLKKKANQFCADRDWDQFHNLKDLTIGLSTEASELLELFRFVSEAELEELKQQKQFKEKLSDEMADVLFFLLRISEKSGIDLTDAFERKLVKNAEKYPVEKARGSHRKYTEL